MTDSKANGCTFVSCNDVMGCIKVVCDVCTDILQQTIGHTSIKIYTVLSKFLDEKRWGNHVVIF